MYFFLICLTSETSETDKEEQQVDKEDKDPWWKPKDLKENLSKGSVTIILLKFRFKLFTVPCVQSSNASTRVSKFIGTSVTYLIFFTIGFGSHINWMSYEQGLKEAKKRFDIFQMQLLSQRLSK